MAAIDLQHVLPIAIPLAIIAVVMLRARRPRRIDIRRLWLAPAVLSVVIGLGLWFTPHPAFALIHYAVMALGIVLGVGAGLARAHTLKLSRDPVSGHIMAQASPLALLVILALFGARMALRQASGIDTGGGTPGVWPATLIDASMLFALAMVSSQRLALWQRVGLLPAAADQHRA